MKHFKLLSLLVIAGMLLAACASAATPVAPTPQPTTVPTSEPTPGGGLTTKPQNDQWAAAPAAALAARGMLVEQLNIDPDTITLISVEQVDWPDACLGVQTPGLACAQVITPGYKVILGANGDQYEFHTNLDGSGVKEVDSSTSGDVKPGGGLVTRPQAEKWATAPEAALSARQLLVQRLHVDVDTIGLVSADKVNWPDSCLGIQIAGVLCAQHVTPGYKIVLDSPAGQYEFHTDLVGAEIRLAAAPKVEIQNVAIDWQNSIAGVCQTTAISDDDVLSTGPCRQLDVRMTTQLSPQLGQPDTLAYFVKTYASFDADTPAGRITFTGQGSTVATPAEQRMIAEWAQLVTQEASGGNIGASEGLLFAWHREGGLAGFCDDVSVYVTGAVSATSCKGGQARDLGQSRLTADQLKTVYSWLDQFKNFELDQTDGGTPATADALTTRMVFSGNGSQTAAAADQQAMQDFAAQLYAEFNQ
jgi:hypothetical protein